MKSFEQQTADTIRSLVLVCVVLAVGLALTISIASWGLVKALSASDAAHTGLVQQTKNRTKNVGVWCGAINQGRDYDRAFVMRVTHGRVSYRLPNLPCAALERKTLASARAH